MWPFTLLTRHLIARTRQQAAESLKADPLLAVSKLLLQAKLKELYGDLIRQYDKRKNVTRYFAKRMSQCDDQHNASWRYFAYRHVHHRLVEGDSLALALKRLVPDSHQLLIETGEGARNPRMGLQLALDSLSTQKAILDRIKQNVTMPGIVFTVTLGILVSVYGGVIVPKFADTIGMNAIGPTLTALYYTALLFRGEWGEAALIGLLLGAYFCYWSLGHTGGPIRNAIARLLPPWSIYRVCQMASVLLALSAMIRARIQAPEACARIAARANRYTATHLAQMQARLENGDANSTALDTGLFIKPVIDRIGMYDDDGEFDQVMAEMGTAYAVDTIDIVDRATWWVGRVMWAATVTLIVAVMTDYFALSDAMDGNFNT